MDEVQAYAELGLKPEVSDRELKATWRKLVSQWHPDRNPSDQALARMQRINTAFELLQQWRAEDAAATPPVEPAPRKTSTRPAPKAEARAEAKSEAKSASKSEAKSGAKTESKTHAGKAPPHTHVIRRKVKLSLEEATLGCTKVLRGQTQWTCVGCGGEGHRMLAQACPRCEGHGEVRRSAMFGWISSWETCEDCAGQGRARQRCGICQGAGKSTARYQRTVRMPAGARSGDVLQASAGQAGDHELQLEIKLELLPHDLFELDEAGQMHCRMPVDGFAWMAERWVEVPTPSGLYSMRLRRDHQSYRLRGQGFPTSRRGERGDLLVQVEPQFPKELTPEQEALLKQLSDLALDPTHSPADSPLRQWQQQLQRWADTHPFQKSE